MRRRVFFLIALVALSLSSSCTSDPDQKVLAEVNGEKILGADLRRAFEEQADNYGPDLLANPEGNLTIKKKFLNDLIEERLLFQEAQKRDLILTPDEEKKLTAGLHDGYNQGEFENTLRKRGISLDAWMDKQKRKKLIEKLLDREVYATIKIPMEEIADYYQRYRPLFREPDRVRCRHIVTSKRDKAETIRRLLENGENFASVAQKYSESPDRDNGGDLGYIARGEYPAIFIQACFTLAVGQTSDVLPSEYGFHIFRVTDKRPGRQLTLSEAKPEIERRLKEEKVGPVLRAWLEQLYRNQKISVDEKALKGLILPAPPALPETQPEPRQKENL